MGPFFFPGLPSKSHQHVGEADFTGLQEWVELISQPRKTSPMLGNLAEAGPVSCFAETGPINMHK